jgi:hypothetical protein
MPSAATVSARPMHCCHEAGHPSKERGLTAPGRETKARPKRSAVHAVGIAVDRFLLRPLFGLAGTAMITGAGSFIAARVSDVDPLGVVGVALIAQALYKQWGYRPTAIRRLNLAADHLTRHLRLRAIKGAAAAGETPPSRDVEWARRWRGGQSHDGETVAGYYEGDLRETVMDALNAANFFVDVDDAEFALARSPNTVDDLWAIQQQFVAIRNRLQNGIIR